ncbi:MAG: hypothetical protein LBH01_07575 [Verrucomicrobiales bacterium]|jgi:hypothetical protein|nr:hypothetical protein [Verrucomicrobiales bacterium]
MKSIILFSCCLFAISASRAQNEPDLSALEKGPLIVNQLPANIKWQVDYRYTAKSATQEQQQQAAIDKKNAELAAKDPLFAKMLNRQKNLKVINMTRPVQTTVTITGTIRHEERIFDKGDRLDQWANEQACVERIPGISQLNVRIDNTLTQNNFPGFTWINKSNFVGIQKHQGTDCLVFSQRLYLEQITLPEHFDPAMVSGEENKVNATAYIQVSNRYPVELTFDGETRAYTYLQPPSSMQVIPKEFQAAIDKINTTAKTP